MTSVVSQPVSKLVQYQNKNQNTWLIIFYNQLKIALRSSNIQIRQSYYNKFPEKVHDLKTRKFLNMLPCLHVYFLILLLRCNLLVFITAVVYVAGRRKGGKESKSMCVGRIEHASLPSRTSSPLLSPFPPFWTPATQPNLDIVPDSCWISFAWEASSVT